MDRLSAGGTASLQKHQGPKVLVISLPKSGTHVVNSVLAQFDGMSRCAHVWLNSKMRLHPLNLLPWPGAETCLMGIKRPQRVKLAAARLSLRRIQPWQYASGHIPYQDNIRALLREYGIRPIFIIRDPRDVLVSSAHFAVDKKNHFMNSTMKDMPLRQRIKSIILGGETRQGFAFSSIAGQLDLVEGWMRDPEVLSLHFENIIGARGAGSEHEQSSAIASIARFIGLPKTDAELRAIGEAMFGKGRTFRKGEIGGWREVFDAELTDLFNQQVGDRLSRIGY